MPTVQFAIASRSVSVDQQTGSLSIFDIIEDIAALTFPFNLSELVFACVLARTPEEDSSCAAEIEISFRDAPLLTRTIRVEFGTKLKARLIIRAGGIPITEPGVLSCSIRGETFAVDGNYRINVSHIQEIPEGFRDGDVTVHNVQGAVPLG